MPKYSYTCNHCDHGFEEWQSIKDTSYPPCPKCGKESKRIIAGGWKIYRNEKFFNPKQRMS